MSSSYRGVRRWRLVHRPRAGWTLIGLYSKQIWRPGQEITAFCTRSKSHELCPRRYGHHHCGIWACATPATMATQLVPTGLYVEGTVELSGVVYDEGWGARAEHGLPTSFVPVPGLDYPADVEQFLAGFGVPIRAGHESREV